MIRSKADYLHYLEADRIALGRNRMTLTLRIKHLLFPDHIWTFQQRLRKSEYYKNVKKGPVSKIIYVFARRSYQRMGLKLGFSIPENVFGPGLAIVHYGTIVVNAGAKVGANCRIHVCTNIGASGGSSKAPQMGDNVYLAPGVKVYGDITIASNTAMAANAAVNKSFLEENTMIGGMPAKVLKTGIDIKSIIKHIK